MNPSLFADRRDYMKYSIIRHLLAQDVTCTICWMMTKEIHENIQNRYVNYRRRWRAYDPVIFDFLKQQIDSGSPCIRSLKTSQSSPIANCTFHWPAIPADIGTRRLVYFNNCINASARSKLIFVDPDNGPPPQVAQIDTINQHKYVKWEEVAHIYRRDFSTLVYHHLRRDKTLVGLDIAAVQETLRRKLNGATVTTLRFNDIAFHFAVQPAHRQNINQAINAIVAAWGTKVTRI